MGVACPTRKLGTMIIQREFYINEKWVGHSVGYDYGAIDSAAEASRRLKALTQRQKYGC